MATTETIFPPGVQVQDENIQIIDDMTEVFRSSLARGQTQRQSYGGPRLKMTRRVFVRQSELGLMLSFLQELRGKGVAFYASPNYVNRGSFPNAELFTNADFSQGTGGGWIVPSNYTLSVADKIMRCTRSALGQDYPFRQYCPYTQYAPHTARFVAQSLDTINGSLYAFMGGPAFTFALSKTYGGYAAAVNVPYTVSAADYSGLIDGNALVGTLGSWIDVYFASMSRCAMVDNGGNIVLYSDQFDTTWSLFSITISANAYTAPDGTTTADGMKESSTSNVEHYVQQTPITIGSGVQDYSISCYVQNVTRSWCSLRVYENTSSTYVNAFFNLSGAGAVGTINTGANWASARASIQAMGSGWYKCSLIARKTNAATGLNLVINSATADNTLTYAGTVNQIALALWRATINASSVPSRPPQSTSTPAATVPQTGNSLTVKGLPASTSGLLLKGDMFEVNGELKICTASLDSEANGAGTLVFGPDLVASPGADLPVIFRKPMGKPMPELHRRANAARSKVRSAIEHVFAAEKHRFGLFVRTIGIARATLKIGMVNLVYNFSRLAWLEGRTVPV